MTIRDALRLTVAACVAAATVVVAGLPAEAAAPVCGAPVTKNVKLRANLNCNGDAIVIDANGVTLNLNGFTILGNGSGSGVVTDGTFNKTTVKNGVIKNFDFGVRLQGSGGLITKITSTSNDNDGINLNGSNNVVSSNTLTSNGFHGMSLEGGTNNLIENNLFHHNNEDGLRGQSGPTNTQVIANKATKNSDDGIDMDNASSYLADNVANDNGDHGIEAQSGATDGGGNVAGGNGNATQCTNILCG